MGYSREKLVEKVISYKGYKESDGTHQRFIDTYNTQSVMPRGYKMKYNQPWCATFVSAIAIELGYTDIIPTECSCYYFINKAKEMGIWEESDSYIPKIGDIVLYDWQDNGIGDCGGVPDHIGYVTSVNGNDIVVTEGNYHDAVDDRNIRVNGRYIRGYVLPKYEDENGAVDVKVEEKPIPTPTPIVVETKPREDKLIVDGHAGTQTIKKLQKYLGTPVDGIISKQLIKYKPIFMAFSTVQFNGKKGDGGSQCIKALQRMLKVPVDGYMGNTTAKALQKFLGVKQDGILGNKTVKALQNWLNNR